MNSTHKQSNEHWAELEDLLTLIWGEAVEDGTEFEFSRKLTALFQRHLEQSSLLTMLASEEVLRRDWDSEEEDSAWAHL